MQAEYDLFSYAVGTIDWRIRFQQSFQERRSWQGGFERISLADAPCTCFFEDDLVFSANTAGYGVYQVDTGIFLRPFPELDLDCQACPAASRREIAAYATETEIHLVRLSNDCPIISSCDNKNTTAIHFAGDRIFVADERCIHTVDPNTNSIVSTTMLRYPYSCSAVNDTYLTIGCDDGTVLIFDLNMQEVMQQRREKAAILAVACTDNTVVSGGDGNELISWDVTAGKVCISLCCFVFPS